MNYLNRKCHHGYSTVAEPQREGWLQDYCRDCPACGGTPVSVAYKLGEEPGLLPPAVLPIEAPTDPAAIIPVEFLTAQFFDRVEEELEFARRKFPSRQYMLAALMEEVGELAQAMIDHSRGEQTIGQVFNEAVQVACMACRVASEGDASFPYRPAKGE